MRSDTVRCHRCNLDLHPGTTECFGCERPPLAEPQTVTAEEFISMQAKTPTRKYRNQPTVVDGIRFDSLAEARRYDDLKKLRDAGEIESLNVHPRFDLPVEGTKIATYVADFCYVQDGKIVVEDVKSAPTRTASYRLKRKLMKAIHGIEIQEVTR